MILLLPYLWILQHSGINSDLGRYQLYAVDDQSIGGVKHSGWLLVVKARDGIPELPRRKQANNLASGNHTDITAMCRRLASPPR